MAAFFKLWLGLFYFSLTVFALPPWAFHKRDGPALPSEDPFYEAPPDFESAEPGAILKNRKVPYPIAAFNAIPMNLAGAHHIMYRSTDNHGNPSATVTTVLIPENANFSKVLSYQVAEDASSPNCGPSYALQKDHDSDPENGTELTQAELILMLGGLENGWIVTAPDFEGTKGAFLANLRAGHAVLDGIRAVLKSGDFTGVSPDAISVMWGYSGGSLASGFAAELQPSYAPELNIVGAAIGGTVPQIYPVLTLANEGPHTGLIPAGIVGLSHEYPEVEELLDEQLLPEKRDYFLRARDQCFGANGKDFEGHDIFSYVKDKDIFEDPKMQEIMSVNSMGNNIPTVPLFLYKADKDEISGVDDTNELVAKYCDAGTIVNHNRDRTADHSTLAITGAPDALIWLKDRLDGKPMSKECTEKSEWVSLLDPKALLVMSKVLINTLLAILGKPIK